MNHMAWRQLCTSGNPASTNELQSQKLQLLPLFANSFTPWRWSKTHSQRNVTFMKWKNWNSLRAILLENRVSSVKVMSENKSLRCWRSMAEDGTFQYFKIESGCQYALIASTYAAMQWSLVSHWSRSLYCYMISSDITNPVIIQAVTMVKTRYFCTAGNV